MVIFLIKLLIPSYAKAIKLNPKKDEAWTNQGIA